MQNQRCFPGNLQFNFCIVLFPLCKCIKALRGTIIMYIFIFLLNNCISFLLTRYWHENCYLKHELSVRRYFRREDERKAGLYRAVEGSGAELLGGPAVPPRPRPGVRPRLRVGGGRPAAGEDGARPVLEAGDGESGEPAERRALHLQDRKLHGAGTEGEGGS